ncbi:T9SS type A sorting domain-containing protein [Bacteroidota bacterium]
MATPSNLNGKHVQGKCVDCSAKPNPTKGQIKLTIDDFIGSDLRFKLFNLDGQLLKSNIIESSVTNLSIENCEDGPYFLKVMQGDIQSKLIKIIKY